MSSTVLRSLQSLFSHKSTTATATASATGVTSLLKPVNTTKPAADSTTTISKFKKPTKPTAASNISTTISKSKKPSKTSLENAVAHFKKLTESASFRRNRPRYNTIVYRLAAAKKFDYIDDIIQHQKQYVDGMTNEPFVVRLLTLYANSGMFDHAHKLFDEMPQLNCKRTVLSFNAFLSACVTSKKYEKIADLFRELPGKLSIEPDTVSYNIVIKAFCEMGSVNAAIDVIDEMEKAGREPDSFTFNTIIDALYQKKQFAEAEKLWIRMESKNIAPNVRSYNSKLRGLCADMRVTEAVDVISELERKGVKPDIFTYNGLIQAFCKENNLVEVKKWYGEILKNDLHPDKVTFLLSAPLACKAGDFGFAYELSKDVVDGKRHVGAGIKYKDKYKHILQRVVDGLAEELELKKAEEIVGLVKLNKLKFKLQLPTGK